MSIFPPIWGAAFIMFEFHMCMWAHFWIFQSVLLLSLFTYQYYAIVVIMDTL